MTKVVAEFSDTFSHFYYATLEMFQAALNNYSMLKLCFFKSTPTNTHATTAYFIVELPQNRGRSMFIFFFFATDCFITQAFFLLKGKLKDIINYFSYEISNDIIQCYQFICWILPLVPLTGSNFDWHYSV